MAQTGCACAVMLVLSAKPAAVVNESPAQAAATAQNQPPSQTTPETAGSPN